MAYGRPVVATPVGGLADAVVDGETGLLVPPGDVDGAARGARAAARRRRSCARGSETRRRRFAEELSASSRWLATATIALYERVLGNAMRLVMTVAARDEADIIDAQLAFHLNAGVDFVIATDHGSTDGTTEIFQRVRARGVLGADRGDWPDYPQSEWVTRMARLAATKHGADWVINSDADEFWWPARQPEGRPVARAATVRSRPRFLPALRRSARRRAPVLRANDGTHRAVGAARPTRRPSTGRSEKVMHRGDPDVSVGAGNHTVTGAGLSLLRGWYPIELLHFPLRSSAQSERKFVHAKTATAGTARDAKFRGQSHRWHAAAQAGLVGELYSSVVVDDTELERGLQAGTLVEDVRLRDALRQLATPTGFVLPADRPRLEFPRPGPGRRARLRRRDRVDRRRRHRPAAAPGRQAGGASRRKGAVSRWWASGRRATPAEAGPRVRALWQKVEPWVGTKRAAFALVLVAMLVYWIEAIAWPFERGRDAWDYMTYYLSFFDAHTPFTEVMLFRTPVTPFALGIPLSLGGVTALEIAMTLFYALTILAWTWAALSYSRLAAVLVAAVFLASPGLAVPFHEASSDAIATFGFGSWRSVSFGRASGRPPPGLPCSVPAQPSSP